MNYPQNILKASLPPSLWHLVEEAYFKLVPAPIRKFVRGRRSGVVFRKAMKKFLKDPSAFAEPGNPVLLDLIYGWGNEAWSARDEYLAACIQQALTTSGPILECGSGLSSVLIGAVAKKRGLSHWVLEHQAKWADKVQSHLNSYGLDSLVHTNPLKNYGDFDWYDINVEGLSGDFGLVVCDGPPSRTKGGRYGLAPVLKAKLNPGCVILLDDGYRKEEVEIALRWKAEMPATFDIKGTVKPYIHMVLI